MRARFGHTLSLILGLALSVCPLWGGTPQKRPLATKGVASVMKNRLIFPGDAIPESFRIFYSKLDSLSRGEECSLNILHIGDSHVQAGYWTARLRDDLVQSLGGEDIDGGMGLVFPHAILPTNNPSSYKSSFTGKWASRRSSLPGAKVRLGLMGLAAWPSAGDTASFSISTSVPGQRKYPFSKVMLWGYKTDGGVALPFVTCGGETLLPDDLGDGSYGFVLEDSSGRPFESESLRITVPSGFVVTGVKLLRSNPGLTLSGVGVNGASLLSYMGCEDLSSDLQREKPDAVILSIGTNDSIGKVFDSKGYKERYRRLVDMILRANPDCAIIFTTVPDSFRAVSSGGAKRYSVNTNTVTAREDVRALSKESDAALWDLFDIMGGLGSMQKWQSADLAAKDKVHFSAKGYGLLGDMLFNALVDSFTKYLEEEGR